MHEEEHETLAALLDEQAVVTFRFFAQHADISVMQAKEVFESYEQENKDVAGVYLVGGVVKGDASGRMEFKLVEKPGLDAVEALFEAPTSHLYSLGAGAASKVTNDALYLCNQAQDRSLYEGLRRAPNCLMDNRWSAVKCEAAVVIPGRKVSTPSAAKTAPSSMAPRNAPGASSSSGLLGKPKITPVTIAASAKRPANNGAAAAAAKPAAAKGGVVSFFGGAAKDDAPAKRQKVDGAGSSASPAAKPPKSSRRVIEDDDDEEEAEAIAAAQQAAKAAEEEVAAEAKAAAEAAEAKAKEAKAAAAKAAAEKAAAEKAAASKASAAAKKASAPSKAKMVIKAKAKVATADEDDDEAAAIAAAQQAAKAAAAEKEAAEKAAAEQAAAEQAAAAADVQMEEAADAPPPRTRIVIERVKEEVTYMDDRGYMVRADFAGTLRTSRPGGRPC